MKAIDKIEKLAEKWWGMLILIAIPIFTLLWPLVFGFRVFGDVDALERLYPIYSFYKNSLEEGQSVFWTPYGFSGFPVFASLFGGFLSPLVYLAFKTFSFVAAYHLLIFLSAIFAAFFTVLFLRQLQTPLWAAFIAGLAFVFSQWRMIHELTIISASVFLPLIFLLLWQMKKKIKIRFVLLGIVALGLGWLISNWDYFIRILFSAAVFALYLGFLEKKYFKFLSLFFIMVFGGALIASIQLIPTYILIQLSAAKAEGIGHWLAVREGLRIGDAAKLFLPFFDAPLLPLSLERLYIGILPLFFFFYAFTLKSLRVIGFFSFLFLLSLFLSINNSPLFWLLHHIPPFNFIHYSFRWMMVGSFAMAVLAGLGVKKIRDETALDRKFLLKIFKWLSIILISFSAVFTLIFYFFEDKLLVFLKTYFLENIYPKTSGLSLDYYYDYLSALFFQFKSLLYLLSPKVALPLIFLAVGYFLLNRFFQGKMGKESFIRLAALFVVLNFVLVFAFENNTFSRKIFAQEPKTVKFLKTREEGRILPFLGKMAEFRKVEVGFKGRAPREELFRFKSEMLFPNINFQYQIASAALYEPLMTKEMAKLLALVGADRVEKFESLANLDISLEEKIEILGERKNILDFLGVRYIISTYSLDEKAFPKIFETKATSLKVPVYIYENKSARPLYYFAKNISQKIEEVDFQGQEGIVLLERKNNLLVLETELEESRYLVFSQSNLPGWQAYLDNKEAAIYDVSGVYMAVLVPQGRHRVVFQYSYSELIKYGRDI